jgi:hypothetical protein
MDQDKVSLWHVAWRSYAAGFLALQLLVFLHFALLNPSGEGWYGEGEEKAVAAVGMALIVGVTIWAALRTVRPPTWQWGALMVCAGLLPAGAYTGIVCRL